MNWPTWDQAAVATVLLLVLAWAARRVDRRGARATAAFATETALISFLYMIWRLARQLPLSQEAGAYERGEQIFRLQRWLHLPDERTLVDLTLRHDWLAEFTVNYYAIVHVPALLAFLVWLWVRHHDRYSVWRNALAITTGFCLFIRFIRVAPPRLMPELGFVDLSVEMGRSVYGNVTASGASDQFAAMPSIHIAWAAIVAFGIWDASDRGRWRWIGPFHLGATFWAVTASANHWWLDGIVALVIIGISLLLDRAAKHLVAARRPAPGAEAGAGAGAGAEPEAGRAEHPPGMPSAHTSGPDR